VKIEISRRSNKNFFLLNNLYDFPFSSDGNPEKNSISISEVYISISHKKNFKAIGANHRNRIEIIQFNHAIFLGKINVRNIYSYKKRKKLIK